MHVDSPDSLLRDLQSVRNAQRVVKYITKEDPAPVHEGVDVDWFHQSYNTVKIAQMPYRTGTTYIEKKLHPSQHRLLDTQTAYLTNVQECSEMMEDSAVTEKADLQVVEMLRCTHPNNPQAYSRKRGVWLHGPVGVGKSETVLTAISHPPFFVYDVNSSFPMHGYNGQADVVIFNLTLEGYEKNHSHIKNLTSLCGSKFDQKHGLSKLVRLTKGRLYITSEFNPDLTNDSFLIRNFHAINMNFHSKAASEKALGYKLDEDIICTISSESE